MSKIYQILLALWSGLMCLGVMTVSNSYNHGIICPVNTAVLCAWLARISTRKANLYQFKVKTISLLDHPSEVQPEREQRALLVLSHSAESQPQWSQDLFFDAPCTVTGQKKERSRHPDLRKQPAALWKALQKAGKQHWYSTLTSKEVKKCFNPNQSTAGFAIKNTPKQLGVMPNKFNNW